MPIPIALQASITDFVLAFGKYESIELSELDEPTNSSLREERIAFLLHDALQTIEAIDSLVCNSAKILLRKNCRRLQLDITRFYADTMKTRPDVQKRFDQAQAMLDFARTPEACTGTAPSATLLALGILEQNHLQANFGRNRLSSFPPSTKLQRF